MNRITSMLMAVVVSSVMLSIFAASPGAGSTLGMVGSGTIAAVPMITANPNPVVIPDGQTEGATVVVWDAGPGYGTARVWSQIDGGEEALFAASAKGSSEVKVALGKTLMLKLYSGDGAQVLASVAVSAELPRQRPSGAIGRRKVGDLISGQARRASPLTFFIRRVSANADVQPSGNYADIAFTTEEPTHPVLEMSTKKFSELADTTPAGQQPVSAFPAGTVTMSRNNMLGAKQSQHTFRMEALAPNRTYYYVVTAAGADGRTFRYWDSFKTLDSRQVKVVFEKVNFTKKQLSGRSPRPNGLQLYAAVNDQWGTSATGYWRFPRDGSFAEIGGYGIFAEPYRPVGWEDINIQTIVDRSPDQMLLKLLANDARARQSGYDGILTIAKYPQDPRPAKYLRGEGSDSGYDQYEPRAYWSTATGEIDTTMGGTNQPGSGTFRLIQAPEAISASNGQLVFEVMGRFEVSYSRPRINGYDDLVNLIVKKKDSVDLGGFLKNAGRVVNKRRKP